jgi:hypothetical protein
MLRLEEKLWLSFFEQNRKHTLQFWVHIVSKSIISNFSFLVGINSTYWWFRPIITGKDIPDNVEYGLHFTHTRRHQLFHHVLFQFTEYINNVRNVSCIWKSVYHSGHWTVFARINTGIVVWNPTRGTDICVLLFCVCVVLCVGSGLATDWSPIQGVLSTVNTLRNWKSDRGPEKVCRAIDRQTDRQIYTKRLEVSYNLKVIKS